MPPYKREKPNAGQKRNPSQVPNSDDVSNLFQSNQKGKYDKLIINMLNSKKYSKMVSHKEDGIYTQQQITSRNHNQNVTFGASASADKNETEPNKNSFSPLKINKQLLKKEADEELGLQIRSKETHERKPTIQQQQM